jgi:hypothetical protein
MIAGVLAGGTQLAAGEEPRDSGVLPPLTGVAVARATGGQGAEWTLSVTLRKEVWHAVAPAMPRKEWPQVTWERVPGSTVSLGTMTFSMGGSADPALCTVVDLEGREVGRDRVLKELETERRLLVSLSGRIPEPRYRRLPSQAELIVVLGPEARAASRTSTPDAEDRAAGDEPGPDSWAEQESTEYFFGLMENGKSFRVGSETDARRYLAGLWRLDRRAHVGGGHYVHADRGDDVTVIWTDAWLVTTVFNHHETRVAESAHRIETLTRKSDGHIVVNGSERFKPLDDDHMAMLGYDFIAVVQRAR